MNNNQIEKKGGPEETYVGEIKNLSYSASGVARIEGKVAFIPHTVTGDVVKFMVAQDKKTYSDGKLIEIVKSSPHRRTAPCQYFGRCGGCQWQHVVYPYQIQSKKMISKDLIERIGGVKNPNVLDTYSAGAEWNYRQRVRFQIGRKKDAVSFGFAVHNSREVVDIETCHIVRKPIAELINKIRQHKNELDRFYDFEIYYSEKDDNFIFSGLAREKSALGDLKKILEFFKGGVLVDKTTKAYTTVGEPFLNYAVNTSGMDFLLKVYAGGFIQANPEVNELILNVMGEQFENPGDMNMLELYAGSGNFSLFFSKMFKQVVSVEGEPSSFKALEENIRRNKASNLRPVKAAVYDEVVRCFNRKKQFDVIFLDPPRIGAKEIMPFLPKLNPDTILYLSCNPSTLARDIQILAFSGYELVKAIPFDMFPQTFHIEILAILKKTGTSEEQRTTE
jgi:23S rRNA (uracil1939-C5)-methyltransferase